MELNSFFATLVLVVLVGALVRPLWNRLPQAVPTVQPSPRELLINQLFYTFSVVIFVATPAASFALTLRLKIHPLSLGILGFASAGVLLSLLLPLLAARCLGRTHLESFWEYMEMRSKLSRKAIGLLCLLTAAVSLVAGLASSLVGR